MRYAQTFANIGMNLQKKRGDRIDQLRAAMAHDAGKGRHAVHPHLQARLQRLHDHEPQARQEHHHAHAGKAVQRPRLHAK